jgi:hypothetical protein
MLESEKNPRITLQGSNHSTWSNVLGRFRAARAELQNARRMSSQTRQIQWCSYISPGYPPQVRADSILRIPRDRVSRISSANPRANSVPRRIITYTLDVMMRRVAAESPSSLSPLILPSPLPPAAARAWS